MIDEHLKNKINLELVRLQYLNKILTIFKNRPETLENICLDYATTPEELIDYLESGKNVDTVILDEILEKISSKKYQVKNL